MKRVLFHCIGDSTSGMGHVMRDLVLADQLVRLGVDVAFATPAGTPGAAWIEKRGYPALDGPPSMMAPGFDAVILDLMLGPTLPLLRSCRLNFNTVVNIGCIGFAPAEDMAVVDTFTDLQVYGVNLFDPPRRARELSGPDYLLVNPDFRALTPCFDGHVVICLGGADPRGLTRIALEGLATLDRPVKAVVGPAARFEGPVPANTWLFRSPESLLPIMDGAALVVTATGVTAHEALCAGIPCVLTNWTADHARTAAVFHLKGVAANLGLWDAFTPGLVGATVGLNLQRPAAWQQASQAARQLVDGQGAYRVARAILEVMR
jgi:spore coat polysaccharide biosynthesis predicted glycosyltransferase SpsG